MKVKKRLDDISQSSLRITPLCNFSFSDSLIFSLKCNQKMDVEWEISRAFSLRATDSTLYDDAWV